jgi:hypothetical protein
MHSWWVMIDIWHAHSNAQVGTQFFSCYDGMNIDLIQNLFHVLQQSSSDQLFKSLTLTLPLFRREGSMKIQSS